MNKILALLAVGLLALGLRNRTEDPRQHGARRQPAVLQDLYLPVEARHRPR